MPVKTIRVLSCSKCGHKWYPRMWEPPKVCPKCKSYGWNTNGKAK